MSFSTFVESWFKIFRKKPLEVVVASEVEPKMFNKKTDAEIAEIKEEEIWGKKCMDRRIKAAEIHKDIANGYLSVDGTRVNLQYGLFECFNIINWGENEKFYCGGWIERHSIQNLEIRKSKICINEYLTENDMVRMLYGTGRIFLKVQDLKSGNENKIIGFALSKEAIIEGLRKVRDKRPKVWERLLIDDMDGPICDVILQYIVYGDVLWD